MDPELPIRLDADALDLFARKGHQGGPNIPQAGNSNAAKVRRVLQLSRDLSGRPIESLRILDLGCGEGVYAIEAALHGAEVVALDARTQRMDEGRAIAERHRLDRLRFVQDDVRNATAANYGTFDVVYVLGLLYHLDAPDLFRFLRQVRELCSGVLIVDSLISIDAVETVSFEGGEYHGRRHREHGDDDTPEQKRGRVLKSIDNTLSFRLTRESLARALEDAGFSSVLECHTPREPDKAIDRVTFAATGTAPTAVHTYPWINDVSEAELEERLGKSPRPQELTAWITRLLEEPAMLRMGHNQRADDGNLGLGWLYYALGRIVRPRTAVSIGSYRGFVPLLLAKAIQDNVEGGELIFIDPSMVDAQWKDPQRVQEYFASYGVTNVRHFAMTTEEFMETDTYRELDPLGLVFVDGMHTEEHARIDFEAFESKLAPRGIALLHDSMIVRQSTIYGKDKPYTTTVKAFVETLKQRPDLEVLDIPFGTGLTLVRKIDDAPPLLEGEEVRIS